ncbi:MAG TPA: iron ABC transporter permease [Acidobacteriaceae bacterium]|jgi:iron complex transport system permease protein|nr:iron ABC transporter permease [Acidobacteriaceae bacterium]
MNARRADRWWLVALFLLMMATTVASIRYGAMDFSAHDMASAVWGKLSGRADLPLDQRIFIELRVPRAILCLLVGACLGVGGTLMQALFRNPIVEPGLVGTSSGAAFGAALFYVFGALLRINLGGWTLPLAACAGGVLSTYLVFALAHTKQQGRSSILRLLLTGLAINALFMSGIGFLSYVARDPAARSIIYWNLGTLSGADWNSVIVVGIATVGGLLPAIAFAKSLNALMIGEDEAVALGVNVGRLKWTVLTINVLMVAVATAFTGVISFVGLIVPHILRIVRGPDNRFLILGSALLGGTLLSVADLIARVSLRPAELPIGIVTAVVGVPVFLSLLRSREYLS